MPSDDQQANQNLQDQNPVGQDILRQTLRSQNLRGIFLMIAGMACFTVSDLFLKLTVRQLPVGQTMIILGIGSSIVFWSLMRRRGISVDYAPLLLRPVIIRNIGDIVCVSAMCLALAYVPLSTVGAVIQTVPLIITIAAALFLGEKVGVRRLTAVIVGFLGVMFIIRPSADGFDAVVTLALLAAFGMAVRDIGTRLTGAEVSTLLLSLYSSVLMVISGAVMLAITGGAAVPSLDIMTICAAMILIGSVGYIAVTNAVRIGEMSVISPFRYSRLLFSLIIGVVILGENIDGWMLLGSALTIGAGLYIWHRELRLRA